MGKQPTTPTRKGPASDDITAPVDRARDETQARVERALVDAGDQLRRYHDRALREDLARLEGQFQRRRAHLEKKIRRLQRTLLLWSIARGVVAWPIVLLFVYLPALFRRRAPIDNAKERLAGVVALLAEAERELGALLEQKKRNYREQAEKSARSEGRQRGHDEGRRSMDRLAGNRDDVRRMKRDLRRFTHDLSGDEVDDLFLLAGAVVLEGLLKLLLHRIRKKRRRGANAPGGPI